MTDFFPRCQHLTLAGARCTVPALRSSDLCFDHHHRRLRRSRRPQLVGTRDVSGTLLSFVYMEDYASVIENLNATALAFSEHSIDHRQVSALTYLMNTTLKTIDRMHKVQQVPKEDMPTEVAYDELHDPIALPDPIAKPESAPTPGVCHPESAPADEGSAVALSESAPAAQAPCVSDHDSEYTHQSADHDEAARRAFHDQQRGEMFRPLNPHIYPALTAAAEPAPERRSPTPYPLLPIPCTSSNLPPALGATSPFPTTCTLTPSATTADSTLA